MGSETRPATEETLTIRPRRRSRMAGSTSRAIRAGATRLVSSCSRTCSSSTSSTAPGWTKPALLTTAHGPPSVIVAISVKDRTAEVGSATSSRTVRTPAPVPATRARSVSACCSVATVAITSKPAWASSSVVARPIPLPASVTTTDLGLMSAPVGEEVAGETNGRARGMDPGPRRRWLPPAGG